MFDLNERVALVTGGSRGIGRSISRELARAGAAVAANYHTSAEQAGSLVKEIESQGGRAVAIQ
jgi:NAD(P)-dependent dehydrogenase (short-subunit alcohol dehydrogenase family)